MKLTFDPPEHDRYLACLHTCFSAAWGDMSMYRWCFMRTAGSFGPERMVISDEAGRWIAGSAITYRLVRLGNERVVASVMTGSWTLSEARGRGLFADFIQQTRKRAAERGAAVVLGFAGDVQRASTKKLLAAGSLTVASANALADVTAPDDARAAGKQMRARPSTRADAELMFARERRRREARGGIDYPDCAAFAGQMIERALPTEIVSGENDSMAIVEQGPDTDRLLFLDEGSANRTAFVRALWGRASSRGRKLFAYGLGADAATAFQEAGLLVKPGYLTVLPASDRPADIYVCERLTQMSWDCQSGDRM